MKGAPCAVEYPRDTPISVYSSDGLLEGDVNGDATADMTIELLGVTSLTGDDIMGLG